MNLADQLVIEEPTEDAEAYLQMVAMILKRQEAMQETLTAILEKFNDLSTEIRPTLDSLTNHPLIKMLSKGAKS